MSIICVSAPSSSARSCGGGRADGRPAGQPHDRRRAAGGGDLIERDPSYSAILGPYTASFYDYVRTDLGFEFDVPYEIIKRLKKWSFDEGKYADVRPT